MAEQTARSPYKGLEPYDVTDRDRFFGREADQKILIGKIFSSRVTLFFGVTGSGKSSTLGAGVIPDLTDQQLDVAYHSKWNPQEDPRISLKTTLKETLYRSGCLSSLDPPDWKSLTLQEFLERYSVFASDPFVIIIDQFEEPFLYHAYSQIFMDFTQELADAINDRALNIAFVLSMREDFLAELDIFWNKVPTLSDNRYRLEKLTFDRAREAIIKPARAAGSEYEPELVNELLRDLSDQDWTTQREPGQTGLMKGERRFIDPPYLQLVCQELWNARQQEAQSTLTLALYEKLQRTKNIVRGHVERVMNKLTLQEQTLAFQMFQYLVTSRGTKMAYLDVDLAEVLGVEVEQIAPVLNYLAERETRILRLDRRSDGMWYELYHDIFAEIISLWSQGFQNNENHRNYSRIVRAVRQWEQEQKDETFLLRGVRLIQADQWARKNPDILTPLEQQFLQLSLEHERTDIQAQITEATRKWSNEQQDSAQLLTGWRLHQAEEWRHNHPETLTAEESNFLQESLTEARRLTWLRRGIIGVIVSIALIASVLGVYAYQQQKIAENARDMAQYQKELAEQARDDADKQREAAEEAEKNSRRQLVQIRWINGINARDKSQDPLKASHYFMQAASVSEDQAFANNAALAGSFLVRNARLKAFLEHQKQITRAIFNPEQQQMLPWMPDQTTQMLQRNLERPLPEAVDSPAELAGATFSPDGNQILTWGKKTVQVWQASSELPLLGKLEHQDTVEGAKFSPDGSRILTWSWDNTAFVWDIAGQAAPLAFREHTNVIWGASFRADGEQVLSWSADGTARVWDPKTGQQILPSLTHRESVEGAAFSPDGHQILTWSTDQTARLWNAETGTPLIAPLSHEQSVAGAIFSSDGGRILTWSSDGTARLWDSKTGTLLTDPLQHQDEVLGAQFSADSQRILTWSADGTAQLWDAKSGQALLPPFIHDQAVNGATFSPDEHLILTWSTDYTARAWDAEQGQPFTPPLQHNAPVVNAMFGTEEQTILTWSSDGIGRVWDLRLPSKTALEQQAFWWGSSLSSSGHRLLIWNEEGHIQVWDTTSGTAQTPLITPPDTVWGGAFSQDERRFLTWSQEGTVQVWDTRNGQPLTPSLQAQQLITGARFSPHGAHWLTWSDDGTVYVWKQPDQSPLILQRRISDAAFHPEGDRFLTWDAQGLAHLWTINSETPQYELQHQQEILGALFSSQGELLLTWSANGNARLWNADTGQPLSPPLRHKAAIWGGAFSPDNQFLLTWGADNTARVWDRNGLEIIPPLQHQGVVTGARFNTDGTHVLTWSDDGSARLWDRRNGEQLFSPLLHDASVVGALFNQEENRILTWSKDGTARLWDQRNGQELLPALRHRDMVWQAAFSPDEQQIFTLSADGAAHLWDIQIDESFSTDNLSLALEFHTGTRLNDLGELEMLSAREWQRMKRQNARQQPLGQTR